MPGEKALRRGTDVPFSSILIDWESADAKRVFTVHVLEPEEPFLRDHFFRTLGDTNPKRELCLRLRDPVGDLHLIEMCLERWILAEDIQSAERSLDGELDRHEQEPA